MAPLTSGIGFSGRCSTAAATALCAPLLVLLLCVIKWSRWSRGIWRDLLLLGLRRMNGVSRWGDVGRLGGVALNVIGQQLVVEVLVPVATAPGIGWGCGGATMRQVMRTGALLQHLEADGGSGNGNQHQNKSENESSIQMRMGVLGCWCYKVHLPAIVLAAATLVLLQGAEAQVVRMPRPRSTSAAVVKAPVAMRTGQARVARLARLLIMIAGVCRG